MADYNISANITANTSGFESGVKKAQASSKKLSKSITDVVKGFGKGGLSGAITSAGLALGGIGLAIGVATKAIKGMVKALDECAEAYKVQLNAERALDTAINNSPYVTGTASKRLKDFASEMQKMSNMGDEELIPFMTQLIASGRTEAETMQIIKTASDMASSGAMTFDTAVTQLNATLNGNIGRLGQQNAELKGLTEEELKNGKAVEILSKKYKGLTEATIDSKKQLKNAIGDLKESFGKVFEDAINPMRRYFAEIIQGWADARKARDEYEGAKTAVESGNATGSQLIIFYEQQLKYIADERLALEGMYGADKEYAEAKLKELAMEENKYKSIIATEKYRIKQEEEKQKAQAQTQTELDKQAEKEKAIADLKDEYLKKLALQEAKWKHQEEVTGQAVKNEEKINFYEDSLVDLMTQAGGQITTNNQLYKDQIKIIERLRAGLDPEQKKTGNDWEKKLREQLIARLEADKEEKLAEVENSKMASWQKEQVEVNYNEQLKKLKLEALEIEKQEALESVKDLANAEEERLRIQEYYENEKFNLILEYAKKNKEAGKIASDSFVDGFKAVTKKLTPIVNEIGKVLGRVANVAKSMFQGGVSIFKKVFEIDVDSVLDAILKIEDKVLSFFVETLPKLPQFVASVMQSISVLLESVLQVVTPEKVSEILINILNSIIEYGPTIIGAMSDIVTNMIDGLIQAIPTILDTMNVLAEKIAEELPNIIQKIIDFFIAILQEPDKIAKFVVTLVKGFVEIFNVLLRNIGPLLEALIPALGKLMLELIKALPDILLSLGEALWEAIKGIGKFIVNLLIDAINLLLDGISSAWTWTGLDGLPHIPKLKTGTEQAQKGVALVGEAGPELVHFNGGEQILNAKNTQKAIREGVTQSGNTFNVTFNNTIDTSAYALMQEFKAYNRQMAINSII